MMVDPGAADRIQLLELTQRFPPAFGGVERQVEGLARGLVAAGIRVEVATSDLRRDPPFERLGSPEPEWPFPVSRYRAIPVISLPRGLGTWAPGMLRRALRSSADVIHAHAFGYAPTWIGAIVRGVRPRPVVITPHFDGTCSGRISRLYARGVTLATLRRADRVVALTELEASRLAEFGVDPARLVVIPNAIDLAEFAPSGAPGRESRPGVVLYVGRLELSQKGLDVLVRAFAQLPRALDVTLRVAGEDWGGEEELRRLAETLGVADRIVFVGPCPRDRLRRELLDADLLVLPSRFEPFGVVLLEAMASGVPIVASRVGGIPEVVQDGKTGLLVPPGDPAPLARAMTELLTDPALRRRLGREGRVAAEKYDWARIIPRWVALLGELTGSRRSPG